MIKSFLAASVSHGCFGWDIEGSEEIMLQSALLHERRYVRVCEHIVGVPNKKDIMIHQRLED